MRSRGTASPSGGFPDQAEDATIQPMRLPRPALIALAVAALAALAFVLVLVVGRGGDDGDTAQAPGQATPVAADLTAGRAAWTKGGCAGCHTLQDAGATGTSGPDLDLRRPDEATTARQVRDGGGLMPSFRDTLSESEIEAVSTYVAQVTGDGTDSEHPVVARFVPDGTRVSDCGEEFACLEQAFGNLVYEKGPKAALADFAGEMARNRFVESNCHRIAHAMGAAALAKLDDKVGVAISEGEATCWSGYYHGVLERSFAGVPRRDLARVSRDVCEGNLIRNSTFIAYQCIHGLGHGLMIHTGYDLPVALATCDRLRTDWDQTSCTGGVFMENISSSYGVESKYLRDDDLIYPCNAVAERHKLYCYLMVTSRILQENDYDWRIAAATCRRAEPDWVVTCFQSLGRDASGVSRQDPPKILEICRTAGDMEAQCVFGASRDIVSNDAGGARAKVLCEGAPARMREYCYYGIGWVLGTLHETTATRQGACREVAPAGRYNTACERGATGLRVPAPDAVMS